MENSSDRRRFLKAGIATTVAVTLASESLARAAEPAPPPEKDGTLIRAADGKLYFIPDDALRPFLLDDKKSAALDIRFGEALKVAVGNLPGKYVADSGVNAIKVKNILLVNVGAMRPAASALKAREVSASGTKDTPTK